MKRWYYVLIIGFAVCGSSTVQAQQRDNQGQGKNPDLTTIIKHRAKFFDHKSYIDPGDPLPTGYLISLQNRWSYDVLDDSLAAFILYERLPDDSTFHARWTIDLTIAEQGWTDVAPHVKVLVSLDEQSVHLFQSGRADEGTN